jgi:hypothetical protein
MNLLSAPPIRRPFTDEEGRPTEWTQFFVKLVDIINQTQRTGTTAQRPNPAPFIGFMFYDTTLSRPIWASTFTAWVDATGAAV